MRIIERKELKWGLFFLGLGLAVRAIFITVFPTRAIIDAYEIIDFSRRFIDGSAFDHSTKSLWLWAHWNPGLPLFLSPFLALFGSTDLLVASTARWTIAMTCGTVGVLPFFILRNVLSFRARVIVSLILALWPGQVAFSGVILQDNLVILPTVTLACLTLRAGALRTSYPVWSALVFALGVFIRQEMLVTNLPLLIVPLGLTPLAKPSRKRLLQGAVIILSAFFVLAGARWKATDRFAISSEHAGVSLLGAYSPGAHLTGYVDYHAFASTFDARFVDGNDGAELLRRSALRLVLEEVLRRPGFHALRIIGSIVYHLKVGDAGNLWWVFGNLSNVNLSTPTADDLTPWTVLDASKVIPAHRQPIAARVSKVISTVIRGYQPILYILFFSCMVVAIRMRWWTVLFVGCAFITRLAFHGLTVIQPRFLLVGTAIEILAVAQAVTLATRERLERKLILGSLVGGLLLVGFVQWSEPHFWNYVIRHDKLQRTYSFAIIAYRHSPSTTGSWVAAKLRCEVREGTVQYLNEGKAILRLLKDDPSPGDRATADCMIEPYVDGNYSLVVNDGYPNGGFPDRVVLIVTLGGTILMRHDMAASAFSGDIEVPLGRFVLGERKPIRVELLGTRPDRGPMWGAATPVEIGLRLHPGGG